MQEQLAVMQQIQMQQLGYDAGTQMAVEEGMAPHDLAPMGHHYGLQVGQQFEGIPRSYCSWGGQRFGFALVRALFLAQG
jgi:hypothetical protein